MEADRESYLLRENLGTRGRATMDSMAIVKDLTSVEELVRRLQSIPPHERGAAFIVFPTFRNILWTPQVIARIFTYPALKLGDTSMIGYALTLYVPLPSLSLVRSSLRCQIRVDVRQLEQRRQGEEGRRACSRQPLQVVRLVQNRLDSRAQEDPRFLHRDQDVSDPLVAQGEAC